MTISTPLDLATDGRDAMIALGMNGEALPREHGFPARMVIPGLYGFISATKWITRLTLTTYADKDAYWTERDWATDAPIKISSRIDTPKVARRPSTPATPSSAASPGRSRTAASPRSRSRSTAAPGRTPSSGPRPATTTGASGTSRWDAEPGPHNLACRVVDGNGDEQTAARADPVPRGLQRHPGAHRQVA